MTNIHPSAIIEEGASLASDVLIGAFAYIQKDVILHSGVEVMQGACIYGKSEIGEGTKIYPYAIIGLPPQDIGHKSEDDVSVIIGKNCTLREYVTINAGTKKGGGITRVGDNCFIMISSHVAHDCQIGSHVIMANGVALGGHVSVGSFTVIGGLTPVHQFVHIGEGCMIAGASAISQDIPPFCLAEGNRAVVKGLNAVGLKRRFDKDDIRALQSAYRKLFRSKNAIKQSASELLASENNEKVRQMCAFILQTKRGIPYERIQDGE